MLKLKELYNTSKVNSLAELLFICEVGKYCHWMYNTQLSLDGVEIGLSLQNTKYWGYFVEMVKNDWVVDTQLSIIDMIVDETELKEQLRGIQNVYVCEDERQYNKIDIYDRRRNKDDIHYMLRTPKPVKIELKKINPNTVLFETYSRGINLRYISDSNTDQLWVSLFAYIILKKYYMKSFEKAIILFDYNLISINSIDYPLILMNTTDILKNTIYFTCDAHLVDQNDFDEKRVESDKQRAEEYIRKEAGYSAWYRIGSDMGLCDNYDSQNGLAFRTPSEKFDYLQELGLSVGDWVVYYTRTGKSSTDYKKHIGDAKIAYINDITKDGIELIFIHTAETYESAAFIWKYFYPTTVKAMYNVPPYKKLRTTKEFKPFYDIGVKYYLGLESQFIVPLNDSEDAVEQYIPRYKGSIDYVRIMISQNDLIYWICKEYKFEFNDILFRSKYIKGATLYDMFQKGEDMCKYGGTLVTKNGVVQEDEVHCE